MRKSTLDHCWLFPGVTVLMVLLMVIAVKAEIRFIDTDISGGHPQLTISKTSPDSVGMIERGVSPLSADWATVLILSTAHTNWTDASVVAGTWETLVYRGREVPFGSIGDRVWEDLDGNGRQDAGEAGWDGIVVDLTGRDVLGNPVDLMTSTAGGGSYKFSRLKAGTYVVTFTRPAGSNFTVQHSAAADGSSDSDADRATGATAPRMLGEGEALTTVDAGLIIPGSIHGYAFEDVNGNGVDDAEPRQHGLTVTLQGDVDGNGSSDSRMTNTDANGEYDFTGLFPGEYTTTLTPPAGSVPTLPTSYQVTVESRQELVAETGQAGIVGQEDPRVEVLVAPNLIFGVTFLGSVHGYVFDDQNGNGVDDDDPGQSGVAFELGGVDGQGNPVLLTSTSDDQGEYGFTGLLPGTYSVTMTVPPNAIPVLPTVYQVTVESRQELVAEPGQAGIPQGDPRVEVLVAPLLVCGVTFHGAIHGFAFQDVNGNGVGDAIDPRLSGRTINLSGTDGLGQSVVLQATTDGNGEYGFTDLYPGSYTVTIETQFGAIPSTPETYSVAVGSRQALVAESGQAGITDPDDPRIEVVQASPRLTFGFLFFM